MTKCEQINDLYITVKSAFTPSANVLSAANKARGMMYFIYMPDKGDLLPLYIALVRPNLEYAIQAYCADLKKNIYHLERFQRAATRWVNGLRQLSYEERLKELNYNPLKKEG